MERIESVSHHTAHWLNARRNINTSVVIASGRDTPAVEIFLYVPLRADRVCIPSYRPLAECEEDH
jgi:hypothetical protein